MWRRPFRALRRLQRRDDSSAYSSGGFTAPSTFGGPSRCCVDSPETGKWIAKAAADTLKRVHLELGGKAPVIVFDDADVETAMETIAATALYNTGQDCTAATRVLASAGVYDDVVNGLSGEAQGYVMGDLRDEDTTLGPVISERQAPKPSAPPPSEGFVIHEVTDPSLDL